MAIPTKSAGGILLKVSKGQVLIVVVERHHNVEAKWAPILRQLPKGGCEPGEGLEEAALREVEEETGYASVVIGLAGTAQWSYVRHKQSWVETVTYFFMESSFEAPRSMHDQEFDVVRWMPIKDAAVQLSYPEERDLIQEIIVDGRLPLHYLPFM